MKNNYQTLSREKLSQLTGQSNNNVRNQLIKMGLVSSSQKKHFKVIDRQNIIWTEEQLNFLTTNYNILHMSILINKIGVSHATIMRKAKKLKLVRPKKIKISTFTIYELKILVDNFDKNSLDQLLILLPNKNQKQILRNQ